jgi:hypothetical protein
MRVDSALGAAAADTRATAAPLIQPRQPRPLVALRSRWGSAGKKNLGVLGAMAWVFAGCSFANTKLSSPAWGLCVQGSLHAVVNAIAHIHIKPPRLTKQRPVAGAAAAIAVASGVVL